MKQVLLPPRRLALGLMLGLSLPAMAGEHYNSVFLHSFGAPLDMDMRQLSDAPLPPGQYPFEIYINGRRSPDSLLELKQIGKTVGACLKIHNVPELLSLLKPGEACLELSEQIKGSEMQVDMLRQRIDISLPMHALASLSRSNLRPLWDDGINGVIANYSLLASGGSDKSRLHFASQFGVNYEAWRVRSAMAWSKDEARLPNRNNIQYLQAYRALPEHNAQLLLGQTISHGNMLGNTQFYGLRLSSDADMMPNETSGLLPQVTGIARGNAKVSISQGGQNLLVKMVAPGPFEINDLPVLLGNQDLRVHIEHADGQIEEFIQAVAVLPGMRPKGQGLYSLSIGQRIEQADFRFAQGAFSYGLDGGRTLNTELVLADRYQAASLGLTQDFGNYGALAFDLAASNWRPAPAHTKQGSSMRLLWAKSMQETGTQIQVLGARHASRGFRDLNTLPVNGQDRPLQDRDSIVAQLGQRFGPASLSLSLSRKSHWDSQQIDQTVGAGFSMNIGRSRLGLSYSQHRGALTAQKLWSLDWQIPLGDQPSLASLHNRWQWDGEQGNGQLAISGRSEDENPWRYTINQNLGRRKSTSAYAEKAGPFGAFNLGAGYSPNRRHYAVGVNGGLFIHGQGLTLGPSLGDTAALLETGVPSVKLHGMPQAQSDARGFMLVNYLTPYRENSLLLDGGSDEEMQADFKELSQAVVPSRGAMVKLKFEGVVGYPTMLIVRDRVGQFLPLGTRLSLAGGREAWVGAAGMAYIVSTGQQGSITANWGTQQCKLNYQRVGGSHLQRLELRCEP